VIVAGCAWILGDDVSTDEILPGRFMAASLHELGRNALGGCAPGLVERIEPGDILVAGRNFGTGSSRQQAPVALREAGFGAVVAASFARIFFRNCVNVGLPVAWSAEAAADARDGDRIEVDTAAGIVRNRSREREYHVPPLPPFVRDVIQAGGLRAHARGRLGRSLVPTEEERR
jgi:3-isopropylmalate dehydratase small subunit